LYLNAKLNKQVVSDWMQVIYKCNILGQFVVTLSCLSFCLNFTNYLYQQCLSQPLKNFFGQEIQVINRKMPTAGQRYELWPSRTNFIYLLTWYSPRCCV